MTYEDILRNKPWLIPCNNGNMFKRMLRATNNNAFVVWNNIQQEFQLHTVEAEELSGDSTNANIPQEVLNDWLINDYAMNDFKKYADDIMSERQLSEQLTANKNSETRRELELNRELKVVERVLGTRI